MFKKQRLLPSLAGAALVVMLAACSGPGIDSGDDAGQTGAGSDTSQEAPQAGGTIWYSTKNAKELVHVAMADGVVRAAELLGYDADVMVAESDAAKQNEQMVNLVDNMDPAAIVVNPYDSDSISDVLNRASDKGIPYAVIDNQANNAQAEVSVLFDSIESGRVAGEEAVRLLTERYGEPKGLVVNIEGDPVAQVARDRAEGFYQVMSEHPEIEVVKLADSQAPEKATAGVSNAIADASASGKKVDLVNSPTDPATLGAIEALRTNNAWLPAGEDGHVFVISHDGMGEILDYIREGYVDAEVVIDIYGVGGIATEILAEYPLKGSPVPTSGTFTPSGEYLNTEVTFTETEFGPTVFLDPIIVTQEDVDNPLIWGNAG